MKKYDLAENAKYLEDLEKRRKESQEHRLRVEENARIIAMQSPPILADLREIGIEGKDLWSLSIKNTDPRFKAALPIILKHLQMTYHFRILSELAHLMDTKFSRPYWNDLVRLYKTTPENPTNGSAIRDGLACALSGAATPDVMEELVSIALDRSMGRSRVLLLRKLKRSKLEIAHKALLILKDDPDTAVEIKSWRNWPPASYDKLLSPEADCS